MILRLTNSIDAFRRGQRVRAELRAPRERLPGGRRQWIAKSMRWMADEFGTDVLRRPIVLPDDVIPDGYDGSLAAAEAVTARIRERMDIPADRLEICFDLPDTRSRRPARSGSRPLVKELSGRWIRGEDHNRIWLVPALAEDPVALVAVCAHEAGHEILLGDGRISPIARPDHESLTDLLTVFFGLGIFTANAAYDVRTHPGGRKLPLARGYLREDALAEALAYYAALRDERDPDWAQYLDRPVRRRLANNRHLGRRPR
ncbi:hypothetical protein FB561_7301 [Kribbella amoyensis]|uniref:Uncharacterized protein n=1 Tax=Kribbella amoyensis TaxID=996641 RepID=A0A561B3P4_9ACTN|nr:hypothetical protein [Kribbella amoyensis]TWD73412.1 hypothetical protein FB561_7301 [Kribbella amoyensis]